MNLGYGVIPRTSVEKPMPSKIDWSKPLGVKIWGSVEEQKNTDNWIDIISVKDGGDGDFLVEYKNKNGNIDGLYFTKQGEAWCYGKIIGKVRNKKDGCYFRDIKMKNGVCVEMEVYENGKFLGKFNGIDWDFKDSLATLKDSSGNEVKVPKGDIKESLKNPGTIKFGKTGTIKRKNNIVIERFEDKVVIKEINLMGAIDIDKKYVGVHSKYFFTPNGRCMYFDGVLKIYKYGVIDNFEKRTIRIGDEFSHTEWNKIWSEIKECGSRLSEIIRKNKRPEQGKKEVLYV